MTNQAQTSSSPRGLGLPTKLTLGFVALLAILIAMGVGSISLLDRLGGAIDVILRENYKSVIACEQMKEALERMDSGALFALAGEEPRGRSLAVENQPRFEAALKTELGNITLPGEGERAARLQQLYGAYAPVLQQVLDPGLPAGQRRALYFQRLYPTFQRIKQTADEILQGNERNMVQANDRARGVAAEASRGMAIALLVGTAFASLAVFLLSRAILGPLERMTEAAREIEGGNLDLTVPVTSRDELGQLAAAFNSMAAGLRELRELSPRQKQHLENAHRMGTSSLEESRRQLHPEPVPPGELVDAAVHTVEPGFEEEGVKLTAEVDPEAPRVLADREKASLALTLLLRNARAQSPAGGAVTVTAGPWEGRVRFAVTDTGPGIPAAHRERIFEPFHEVPGTQDLDDAGFGLAIAKGVVQSHGGEIHCESEEGRGSTFWFTLPVAAGNL
jgi:signal transduction histidine kinase